MTSPSEVRTEVIATLRTPDGDPSGEIDTLVIRQKNPAGEWYVLPKPNAVVWALRNLLWCKDPYDGRPVNIEAVDGDNDGRPDYVRTVPDSTRRNNLLALFIWDRRNKRWLDAQGRPASGPT